MRRLARELVFKTIYEGLFNDNPNSFEYICEEYELNEDDLNFAKTLLELWDEYKAQVKSDITNSLIGYEYDRVYKVDIALISLGIIEINYYKQTPKNVVINEVVELSKKYSTDKSYSFINGILKKMVE